MLTNKNGPVPTRYFNYKSDYVVVFIISEHKHLICRSVALGDPVIVLEHRYFNDEQNYILEDGVYYTWKEHEIELLDLLPTVGLRTTEFFDYLHSKIGLWLISSLQDNSLLLNWILPTKGETPPNLGESKDGKEEPYNEGPFDYSYKSGSNNAFPAVITYHMIEDKKFLLFKGKSNLFLRVDITSFEDKTYGVFFSFQEGAEKHEKWQHDGSNVTEEVFTKSFDDVNAISKKLLQTVNELFGFDVLHLNKLFTFSEDRETVQQRINKGNKENA